MRFLFGYSTRVGYLVKRAVIIQARISCTRRRLHTQILQSVTKSLVFRLRTFCSIFLLIKSEYFMESSVNYITPLYQRLCAFLRPKGAELTFSLVKRSPNTQKFMAATMFFALVSPSNWRDKICTQQKSFCAVRKLVSGSGHSSVARRVPKLRGLIKTK